MNIKTTLFLALIILNIQSFAQDRSAFRSGYTRIGINTLGKSLDNRISPKQNISNGNYGASTGFVFEQGKVFYFRQKDIKKLLNFGLDWTYGSMNYNKMDKWEAYGKASGSKEYAVDGSKIAVSISSKLGPVLSFNPIEKLVIDIRAQLAPTFRIFDLTYNEGNGNTTPRYFSFINSEAENQNESSESESIKNRIAFGFQKSFGITVRRKAIGLSLEYVTGNVRSNYEAEDNTGISNGKMDIPVSNVQLKLSFTL